ncbi:NAD(P)-binding protein [Paxillus ammoniavirescens]|nr:NAD(P)-binding protein [Paxillus ammoniavirescens]
MAGPRVWLITGTSSGFGRRLVTAVLARGDRVIATARSIEKIENIPNSPNLHLLQLDITSSPATIKAVVDEAAKKWGTIDVLVNNAGVGMPGLLEEGGIQKMIAQYEVGVFGPLNVTNAVLPYMRKQRNGTVVIVGSRTAWRPEVRGVGFYGSSKAAVQTMGETLAIELAPLNIRVLIVEPGSFRTEGIYTNLFDVSNPICDYDEQRADSLATYNVLDGKQPGDPVKAMNAVVDVVRGEGVAAGKEWPLYLVLGRDAEIDIRNKCAKMIRHLDEWSDVVRGVDIDEV